MEKEKLQLELELIIKQKKVLVAELEIKNLLEKIESEKAKVDKLKAELTKKKFTPEENKVIISIMKGLPIRHIYKKKNDVWTGICDGKYFLRNDNFYETPSGFAKAHLMEVAFDTRATFDINGWNVCEVYYIDSWIKFDDFRRRVNIV